MSADFVLNNQDYPEGFLIMTPADHYVVLPLLDSREANDKGALILWKTHVLPSCRYTAFDKKGVL